MSAFDPLPGLALSWSQTSVPETEFLRYVIYRRVQGEPGWEERHRIYARAVTYWVDYRVAGGVTYEYAVSVVQDVAGEEVESERTAAVPGTVHIRDLWVHDERTGRYAQLAANALDIGRQFESTPTRVWAYDRPVAVVGRVARRTIAATVVGQWHGAQARRSSPADAALETLDDIQRNGGGELWLRHGRGLLWRVVFEGVTIRHSPVGWNATLTFTEVRGGS